MSLPLNQFNYFRFDLEFNFFLFSFGSVSIQNWVPQMYVGFFFSFFLRKHRGDSIYANRIEVKMTSFSFHSKYILVFTHVTLLLFASIRICFFFCSFMRAFLLMMLQKKRSRSQFNYKKIH